MTTIVYRDGLMIADTRAYGFDSGPVGIKTKVHLLESGSLFACSTSILGGPTIVLDWVRAGMDRAETPEIDFGFQAILVDPVGREAALFDEHFAMSRVHCETGYAVGSGERYAKAALHLGLTAERALEAACDLDQWTEFPIRGLRHDGTTVEHKTRRALNRAR